MSGELEKNNVEQRGTGRDGLLVFLLGAALLAAGWLDVRAYLHHRGKPRPEFAFLDPANGQRTGDTPRYRHGDTTVFLDHLGGLEAGTDGWYRHGLGPRGAILVWTQRTHARLHMRYFNAVENQDMTVSCNGQVVEPFAQLPAGTVERSYLLTLHGGRNEIDFDFTRYNQAGAVLNRDDTRPMAGDFQALDLTLD